MHWCRFVRPGQHSEQYTRIIELFKRVDIEVKYFGNLNELRSGATSICSSQRILCLVHEDAYDKPVLEPLALKTALVTFGPKCSVGESRWHLRSLTEILPSVLFRQLSSALDEAEKLALDEAKKCAKQEVQVATSQDSGKVGTTDLRFLIDEDNLVNQNVLKRILLRLGHHNVDIVGDGQAAVLAEAEKEYDLI